MHQAPTAPPRLRVLLVEDEALIASELSHRLTRLGHEVVDVVDRGSTAVAVALERRPDLLMLDLRLRGDRDGISVAAEVRQRADIPAIFVTAYSDAETLRRAKAVEPLGYLLKPFSGRMLEVTLEMAVHTLALRRERQQVLSDLRSAKERTKAVLDNAPDAILGLDADARVVEYSQSARELFGAQPGELLGARLPELVANGCPDLDALRAQVRPERPSVPVANRARGRCIDGTLFPARVHVSAHPLGGAVGFTVIVHDLRDELEAEQRLLESQKREVSGIVAGMVAHDINNLLTVVQCAAGLLGLTDDPSGSLAEIGDELSEAARQGANLNRRLLSFVGGSDAPMEVVDPVAVVDRVLPLLDSVAGDQVDLRVQAQPSPTVRTSPSHVEQVLLNLVVNARDAMPQGGRATVRVQPSGEGVTIAVQDNGVGMDADTLARCRTAFFTTKAKGTGLGLATVQAIVRRCDGRMAVTSEPGIGTTVEIWLPAAEGEVAVVERATPAPVPVRRTVLVVDDDESVLNSTARMLERAGFEAIRAPGAGAALVLVQDRSRSIDLALVDFGLPLMDGYELVRRLRRMQPEIRCVVVTGGLTTPPRPPCPVLHKPWTLPSLLSLLADPVQEG